MPIPSQYVPDPDRYDGRMPFRRCGRSGLLLPEVSLGFWHNFGDDKPLEVQREIMRTAFDLGITHFDLANNYGPPYGTAEVNAGRILREDFAGRCAERPPYPSLLLFPLYEPVFLIGGMLLPLRLGHGALGDRHR